MKSFHFSPDSSGYCPPDVEIIILPAGSPVTQSDIYGPEEEDI